ncbi:hypothetical protein [Alicyclobacillus sp.]|uniref:hypothetical protein n=1 Tax=Alicyclobacillus sp. TaxID=61169 RepID=UPI0025C487ED|nr:hypothetical protein [Alicyclobacillus sp.]MCL6517444.1 hypothetical protein [Alicyclobacillus sp.]
MWLSIRPRRRRAHLSQFHTTVMHRRNPYVVTAWSLLTPGLGNMLQDRQAKGLILILWGLAVNTMAKVNLGVHHSLTGRFDLAKHTVDTRWLLLYLAVYTYSAWSAFRGTVDLNNLYLLADREDAPIPVMVIQTLDINYLDRRHPWVAALWSALMPGLGAFYLHRIVEGFFFVAWTIFVMVQSHTLQAIHLSLTGHTAAAAAILDIQWFLYIPSIYGFEIYSSYVGAVELNRVFQKEQSLHLRQRYQRRDFEMPV